MDTNPSVLLAYCESCGASVSVAGSTLCEPCALVKSRPQGSRRRRRQPPDLSGTTASDLVEEGRYTAAYGDPEKARRYEAAWRRLMEWYGPAGTTGLRGVDMSLPLLDDDVEALMWAELASFGLDRREPLKKDSLERVPLSSFTGVFDAIDWKHQLEAHPPPYSGWKGRHRKTWRFLHDNWLTRSARNASTPLMLDEMMRLVALLSTPTGENIRSTALAAVAMDPGLVTDAGHRPSWGWFANLDVERILDLGDAGMRLTSKGRKWEELVLDDRPVAEAIRDAVASRSTPVVDDEGRVVVIDGKPLMTTYTGPLWTNQRTGCRMTGQGVAHRVTDMVASVFPEVVHDKARFRVAEGQALLFDVPEESRPLIVEKAGRVDAARLRDAAWIANAWWVAARGMEILGRRFHQKDVVDSGVIWELPRKRDPDGRRPFYGAPHLIDRWIDPRSLLVEWLDRLDERWQIERGCGRPDDAPVFPDKLSARGLPAVPKNTNSPNRRLKRHVADYNEIHHPDLHLDGVYTSHSLRSGFANSGRELDLPTATIMLAGDWHDYEAFMGYMRRVAPLTAGSAAVSMAQIAGIGGGRPDDSLLARVRALRPDPGSDRLCGHAACLEALNLVGV